LEKKKKKENLSKERPDKVKVVQKSSQQERLKVNSSQKPEDKCHSDEQNAQNPGVREEEEEGNHRHRGGGGERSSGERKLRLSELR
jgi:hypothetical protein